MAGAQLAIHGRGPIGSSGWSVAPNDSTTSNKRSRSPARALTWSTPSWLPFTRREIVLAGEHAAMA